MTTIGQRDYPDVKLGWGTGSIADYGCTLACLAMMADIDILELNRMLKGTSFKDSAFAGASQNLINWTKLEKYTNSLIKFHWRGYTYDDAKIKEAISKWGACLVEVDFDGTPRTDDKHWILAKGNKKANDPWSGNEVPTNKYSLWTGWAEIEIKKGVNMPLDPLQECLAQHKKLVDEAKIKDDKIITLQKQLDVKDAKVQELQDKIDEHKCPITSVDGKIFGEETGTQAEFNKNGELLGYKKTYKPGK